MAAKPSIRLLLKLPCTFQHIRGLSRKYPARHYAKDTVIEEDTRYKNLCTWDNDTSVPSKVGTLGPHTVPPVAIRCPIVFS